MPNGLFLQKFAHLLLGEELAFLKTPNFAMQSDDVDENTEPNKTMYTAHIIKSDETERPPSDLVPNSQLKIVEPVSPQFPPDILFDAVYASMVLYHFGTQRIKDSISTTWRHIFYSNGPTTRANADHMTILGERAATEARKEHQAQERRARSTRCGG